jgi:hypothetical protein
MNTIEIMIGLFLYALNQLKYQLFAFHSNDKLLL